MTPPMAQSAPRGEPQGLGGWLIAWAAWAGLVSAVFLLGGVGMALRAFDLDGAPRRVGDVHIQPVDTADMKVEAFVLIAVAILGIAVFWLHLTRSKRARLAYCAWLLAVAAYPLFKVLQQGLDSMMLPLLVICVGSVVGVAYFLRSRRVRNTFVR
jgi:hypothetical protein